MEDDMSEKKSSEEITPAGAVEVDEQKLDEASGGLIALLNVATPTLKFTPVNPQLKITPTTGGG
jgi:hypothetical protein